MLTRGVTQKIELPHEPGQWVEVRALSGLQLEAARDDRTLKAIRLAREMGPALQAPMADAETRAAVVDAALAPVMNVLQRLVCSSRAVGFLPIDIGRVDDGSGRAGRR